MALVTFVTAILPPAASGFDVSHVRRRRRRHGINTVNPGFDPTMPPQFNLASVAGQGSAFQSCNGQLQQSVQAGMQGLGSLAQSLSSNNSAISGSAGYSSIGSMGFGINAVCSGTDVGPTADSMSCDSLTLPDGTIDTAAMQSKAVAIQMALGNVQCKKNKFQAIQNQLSCLSAQADTLSQQLTSIQGAYQTNIQRMQQDVQKINQVVSDRQSEDQDVLTRLNGSSRKVDGCQRQPRLRATAPRACSGSATVFARRSPAALAAVRGGSGKQRAERRRACLAGGAGITGSIPGQIQTLKDQMTGRPESANSSSSPKKRSTSARWVWPATALTTAKNRSFNAWSTDLPFRLTITCFACTSRSSASARTVRLITAR